MITWHIGHAYFFIYAYHLHHSHYVHHIWTTLFPHYTHSASPMHKPLVYTRMSPFSILAFYLVLLTDMPLFPLWYSCVLLLYINPCTVALNPKFNLVSKFLVISISLQSHLRMLSILHSSSPSSIRPLLVILILIIFIHLMFDLSIGLSLFHWMLCCM